MATGELIRKYRKAAGLTQKELGERSGIAEPTIRKYESNRLRPKIETLQKIASALDVNWLDLFYAETEEQMQEARTVQLYNYVGLSTKEAKELSRDESKKEKLFQVIQDDVKKLNQAGIIAAGQLILSVVEKRYSKKSDDPNGWMYEIMNNALSTVEEYDEVQKGIEALLKIPAYKSPQGRQSDD